MYSAVITPPTKKSFAILDVGTVKVVCMIVKASTEGVIKVLSISCRESAGVYSGAIINAKIANNCILSVLEEAEKLSEEIIEEVYVNIAGSKMFSQIISTEITDINNKVTLRDINRIINLNNNNINNKEVIIHNIPTEYILDNIKGIGNPIGMYGNKLKVNMHTITMAHSVLLNLEHCVTSCQTHFKGCIISGYSSGLACISDDEKELGVTVIDIGGGSTSIGIFMEGNLTYTTSIPIGGNLITRDIACAFGIDMINAEKIKVLKGNVIFTNSDQDNIIEVDAMGESENKVRISVSDLVSVIRPRVEEIFEMVYQQVKNQITTRVVITGGTSQLMSIRELASHILGCQTRIGTPIALDGMGDYNRNSSFSAIVGSALLIMKENQEKNINAIKKGMLKKVLEFIRGE